MNNYIHTYYPIFRYFSTHLGKPLEWWEDKRVLDFGGNCGNTLRDPTCTIQHQNYHCLDISKVALEIGKQDFPDANWHHYNRFNVTYNYTGNKNEPFPVFDNLFDVILIYSVFTSTSKEEMCRTVNEELLPLLKPGGILMNTYLSLDSPWPFSIFLRKKLYNNSKLMSAVREKAEGKDYFYLAGADTILSTEEELLSSNQEWILSFYKDDVIQQLFPKCEIKPFLLEPAGLQTDLIHHCIIMRT